MVNHNSSGVSFGVSSRKKLVRITGPPDDKTVYTTLKYTYRILENNYQMYYRYRNNTYFNTRKNMYKSIFSTDFLIFRLLPTFLQFLWLSMFLGIFMMFRTFLISPQNFDPLPPWLNSIIHHDQNSKKRVFQWFSCFSQIPRHRGRVSKN